MHRLLRDYLQNENNKASVNELSGKGSAGSAPASAKEVFAKHCGCTGFYGTICRMSKKERHQPTDAVV